jgi:23S rRNA (guanosine2251-2'-O)-methyltransferase
MHSGRTTRPVRSRARDGGGEGPLAVFGANTVLELLRSAVPVSRLELAEGPRRAELEAAAAARGVAVERVGRAELEQRAGSRHHQGALALTPAFAYAVLDEVAAGASLLVLDGIQDPRNLGAILRTARAAGVGGVILPRDRSVGVTSVVVAASAGLLFGLKIARVSNLVRALEILKERGFWLVALAPTAARTIYQLEPPPKPALVVGGEGEGLRHLVRRSCDFEVSIPMADGVESLNAAVATAVALYELLRRPQGRAVP